MGRPFRLRAIALLAAYAVALQGLFAAFAPVAVALPSGVLCSGATVDVPAVPPDHEPGCSSACVMLGAATAPRPPDVAIGQPVAGPVESIPFAAPLAAAPRGLPTARAPPSV